MSAEMITLDDFLLRQFMKLTSPAFENNGNIPSKYTCDGKNVSPPLHIEDAPKETRSLALIVDDPDASKGDWVHWIVLNINPENKEIKENDPLTEGIQCTTDFGETGWGGPCPPSGIHHYQFKLYALDIKINVSTTTKKAEIEKAMQEHILEKTILVGIYVRQYLQK